MTLSPSMIVLIILGVLVVAVGIYFVTRPSTPDASSRSSGGLFGGGGGRAAAAGSDIGQGLGQLVGGIIDAATNEPTNDNAERAIAGGTG